MKNKKLQIAIVIPTFNERGTLILLIPEVKKHHPKASIIVVDDNSPDHTAEGVEELMKRFSGIHLIKRKKKEGRGSAVIEGFKYARTHLKPDFYIEMDADLSHDPGELKTLLGFLKQNNIVIASRYLPTSKIKGWPLRRRITSMLLNLLIKRIFSLPLSDNTNGYRGYGKDTMKYLIKIEFMSKGYVLLVESAYKLHRKKYKFVEFPSVFTDRTLGSSKAGFLEIITSIRDLIKMKFS